MSLFPQLPADLEQDIVGRLTSNEVACIVRPLNTTYAATYRSCTVVRLSQPVLHSAYAQQWGANSPALRSLTLKQRQELLRLTATSGVLENLVLALDSAGCLLTEDNELMEAAGAAGHLHICLFLRDKGLGRLGRALKGAAGVGWRHVCEQLLALGCGTLEFAASAAAKGGHVGLMDRLLALAPQSFIHPVVAIAVVWEAASGCDLATLQRLLTTWLPAVMRGGATGVDTVFSRMPPPFDPQSIVAAAACSPTPDWRSKVEWLEGRFPDLPRPECWQVVKLPDMVERLAWLRGRGYPVGEDSVSIAAKAGNIAALTYLLGEAGVRVASDSPTQNAAGGGHLAALQLLVARGCPVDAPEAINEAAANGHLAVVVWLVEELGVEVSELGPEVMDAAAQSGSVELLSWLHDRGCPWHEGTFAAAAEGGCEAALEWLVERGCPLGDGTCCYEVAAVNGDLATVRFLRRRGVRWGPDDTISPRALEDAPLAMLRWLVEEAAVPVDWEEAQRAMEGREDREAFRDWLLEGRRRQEGERR